MDTNGYDALLKRARAGLKADLSTGSRFNPPDPEVLEEGRTTLVRNFADILDAINRPSDHMVPLLLKSLGRAGEYENGRLVLQGKVTKAQVKDRVNEYISTYVICGECGAPDTHLERDHRILTVRCDACGAHRPVKARAKMKGEEAKKDDRPKAGMEVEVEIVSTGRRGDGVARMGDYTVFVTGAKQGQRLKVKINGINGNNVFADPVA